jgi:hypothetical protein
MNLQNPGRASDEAVKSHGSLFFTSRLGIGRWHFGKADYRYNSQNKIERFKTTIFIIILFIPLIPTGSYLVEKRKGFFSKKVLILEELPLDWWQVVRVWLAVAAGLLALSYAWKFI